MDVKTRGLVGGGGGNGNRFIIKIRRVEEEKISPEFVVSSHHDWESE